MVMTMYAHQKRRLLDMHALSIRHNIILYISVIVACKSASCWTVHSMATSSSSSSSPPPTPSTACSGKNKARFITNKMCPFAQKVWIALEESQLPYELQEISLYGANGKPAWFRKLNPGGTVPVLVYSSSSSPTTTQKEVVLPDSDLILDRIQQGLIELQEKGTRNTLRSSSSEQDVLLIQSWRKRINDMLPVGKQAVLSSGAAANSAALRTLLQDMDQSIVGPYLTGNQVTVADCHAFPFIWRLSQEEEEGIVVGMKDYKHLQAWLTLCSKRPAFQRTIQSAWWWWWW